MNFTSWQHWPTRNNLGEILRYPGIYAVRFSSKTLPESTPFEWTKDIIYVGMTNSVGGLRQRLAQFDETMRTSRVTHGGADRVRFRYRNYSRFCDSAYVSVCSIDCVVTSNKPEDLRLMGKVAAWEYLAFATYVEKFGELPEFNSKKAPKYSKTAQAVSSARVRGLEDVK